MAHSVCDFAFVSQNREFIVLVFEAPAKVMQTLVVDLDARLTEVRAVPVSYILRCRVSTELGTAQLWRGADSEF